MKSVDYDLVIIGATYDGLTLAKQAIALNQRVALIRQCEQPLQDLQIRSLFRVLNHCAEKNQWAEFESLLDRAIAPTDFYEPLAKLSEAGVDVVMEQGAFHWQPSPVFQTENRQLTSQNFVVATGVTWDNGDRPNSLTLPDLLRKETWSQLSQTIVINGTNPQLVSLAYYLAKQGRQVQLLISDNFYPTEDQDLTHHLQTFLEIAGVEVYRNISPEETVQIFNQPDISIIDGDRLQGATNHLNLPPDSCRPDQMWLRVNEELQTAHPNIYGCGAVLGGYNLPELTIGEARFLAQNISDKKSKSCPYELMPYRLFEPYPFDHVGIQNQHMEQDTIVQQTTITRDNRPHAETLGDLILKVWLSSDNHLLGATILGDRTGKLIYHCRDHIATKQPFTSWSDLLECSGVAAEIW